MFEQFSNLSLKKWSEKILGYFFYMFSKWYLLILAFVCCLGIGFLFKPETTVRYSATYSFVLSTETRGSGLTGLASQFGLDMGTGGSENIFSGDNIIELFKSRKMLSYALMSRIDSLDMNLLSLITKRLYPTRVKELLPFPGAIGKFNKQQKIFYEEVVTATAASFNVFKKDKKLIFYLISATSSDETVAFYIAKYMLEQSARFFIETKVKVARNNFELLTKEADSLGVLLGSMYRSTANENDRSFNINPSVMVQRSGAQLNQSKSAALAVAYTEVMRNLEIAKVNIQKETPLFQIIDEPVLPLTAQISDGKKEVLFAGLIGLLIMAALLVFQKIYKDSI